MDANSQRFWLWSRPADWAVQDGCAIAPRDAAHGDLATDQLLNAIQLRLSGAWSDPGDHDRSTVGEGIRRVEGQDDAKHRGDPDPFHGTFLLLRSAVGWKDISWRADRAPGRCWTGEGCAW